MEKDKEQLIEAYFSGTLTQAQQKELEWLLHNDSDFSESFNFEKEVHETIVYNERQVLKSRFRNLDKSEAKPVRNLTPWWYAAASVLLLVSAVWFFSDRQAEVSTEKLYAEYMEPYPNILTPKVRGNADADKLMAEALSFYDQEAYSEAVTLLEQIHKEQPNDQVAFYLAISHLMLQEANASISLLESDILKNSQHFSPAIVNWYLGMAFLQQNDREQALSYFKLVEVSNDSLSEHAKRIVKALENR